MKLETLLKGIACEFVQGGPQQDITGVNIDSRQVKPGDMFIAVKGTQADGMPISAVP